jgi:OHCU decarboxylase
MLSSGLLGGRAGRPGRAAALARFLDHIATRPEVWVARRVDIARHWIRHHPPAGGLLPSRLSPGLFMELFSDLAEHTPDLATEVHAAGLTPAQDSAEGLHRAFVAALRAWPKERQTAFLNAHPDLAGKLHAARELTPDSAREQGAAGLDALTEAEHARFLDLNAAYRARHGFPFILAVRGHGKQEVLAAFEARLNNDPSTEHAEALRQVERILLLRLQDRMM